ncbi:MAG: alpha/beta hydrolase family esterase [Micromonosporaceae bacterium]
MTRRARLLALLAPVLITACATTPAEAPRTGPPAGVRSGQTLTVDLANRPFRLHVPASYRPEIKVALVMLLHGYSSNAAEQEAYFQLTAESERRGFLYAMPDGTVDSDGNRFWNATTACCDFHATGVDDSDYLSQVLHAVAASYAVDAGRVFLVGHSNGGFMAYRMACEHADAVTAIISLAGAMAADASGCQPSRPVSVLQIHGTNDQAIRFDGGTYTAGVYPSAATTLMTWRQVDGCADPADTSLPPKDLVADLPGPETTVTAYGCQAGSRVELWTIVHGGHVPSLTANFAPAVIDFLYSVASP